MKSQGLVFSFLFSGVRDDAGLKGRRYNFDLRKRFEPAQ